MSTQRDKDIEEVKQKMIQFFNPVQRPTPGKDSWKQIIDEAVKLSYRFDLDKDLGMSIISKQAFLDAENNRIKSKGAVMGKKSTNVILPEETKAQILREIAPLTLAPETVFGLDLENILTRFETLIQTMDDVNKYELYSEDYEKSLFPSLWRKTEKFTPVQYLAKASPICAEPMLLILLKAGANLSMRAVTKGCMILPTRSYPFFKKGHCTTIGKLARKTYSRMENGLPVLIPKTATMYMCLKDLNDGTFLQKTTIFSCNQRNRLQLLEARS